MSLDAAAASARLREELERLVEEILPGGDRVGAEYRGRGPDGAMWSVVLRGSKRGLFASWGDQQTIKGDPLELVRWGVCNGDRKAAFAWALRWLGEEPGQPASPEERRARRQQLAQQRAQREAEAARQAEARQRAGKARWLEARPLFGTPAAAYLAGRGVGIDRLPDAQLNALRFAPAATYGWDPAARAPLITAPAMLASVIEPGTGRFVGCHHTFLELRGGAWRKASWHPAKFTLGAYTGGLIPLTRGSTGRRFSEAQGDEQLALAEGIENALSIACCYPEIRTAAGVAIQNLEMLALPAVFSSVMLVCDRDGENDAVRNCRARTLDRWRRERRATATWRPPAGFKDANDYWQATLAAIAEEQAREGKHAAA